MPTASEPTAIKYVTGKTTVYNISITEHHYNSLPLILFNVHVLERACAILQPQLQTYPCTDNHFYSRTVSSLPTSTQFQSNEANRTKLVLRCARVYKLQCLHSCFITVTVDHIQNKRKHMTIGLHFLPA